MAKTKKQRNFELEQARKHHIIRNTIVISILAIGAIVLCIFIGLMQNYVTEQNQKEVSNKILDEVAETLDHNDKTIRKIEFEFDKLNTTTLQTLNNYIQFLEIFNEFNNVTKPEDIDEIRKDLSKRFNQLSNDIGASNVFLVDQSGEITVGSQVERIGENLTPTFTQDELTHLTTYSINNRNGQNGTELIGNEVSYQPIIKDYQGYKYYTYSTYYGTHDLTQTDYFLITSVNTSLLDKELDSIKQISSVLDGVSVGKNGFLFALDTDTEKFTYFVDTNKTDLTGKNYLEHGLTSDGTKNAYSGYQTIDGVKYFCVSQEFNSKTYGEFTVIAAVVAKDELIQKIATTIIISCFAFVVVAAIVVGYGMIIKKDIANHTLDLENKYTNDLLDESETSKIKLTDDEIQERVKIKIEDTVERNADKQLARVNLGTRNARGVQRYLSLYMAKKIIPVFLVGVLIVFGISFFSQTLLAFQEAINVSDIRIQDVQQTMITNAQTAETIRTYINEQYLSKSKLISYLIEEHPEYVLTFDYDSDDVHKVGTTDVYGNKKYSIEKSEHLQGVCDLNNLEAIYIYDEDGQCIATNTDYWYYNVKNDETNRLSPLENIISGKTDYEVEDVDFGSDNDIKQQYIAYIFNYYTYSKDGKTIFASKADYLDPTWSGPKITKHRSTVQVDLSVDDFNALFEVTKFNYVLNNIHVYGEDSFFILFDTDEDHTCLYSKNDVSIGKKAVDLGLDDKMFKLTGSYNGFTTIDGVEHYQTFMLVGDHYYATAIPTETIYQSRNTVALYTLLFASIFIFISALFYAISSDKSDNNYISYIKIKDAKEEKKTNFFFIKTASGLTKTSSASSRYTKILWKNKTVEQKLGAILMGYLFAASVFIGLMLINIMIKKDTNSIFTYIFSGEWDRGLNIFSITASFLVFILVIAATNLIKFIVKSFCGALGARIETLGNLIISIVKYGCTIGGLFYILYLFGFDTTSLLTSAGILTIVVGLGAQSLISDIIAGMFIVFEGEFRVGDIVTIGDFRGQVIEIGLRTTKLLDIANNIKIYNNSTISGVLNMTKESSFAFITVGIEYGESLERVEKVLQKGFPQIKKRLPSIVEGPFYRGVMELGTSSVNIGIAAKCSEQDRVQLARDLNREVFLLFNKNNINIPFPQVTLSYLDEIKSEQKSNTDFLVTKTTTEDSKSPSGNR